VQPYPYQKRIIGLSHIMGLRNKMGVLVFSDNPTVQETKLVVEELKTRGIHTGSIAPWDVSLPEMQKLDVGVTYAPSNMLNRGSTFELIHRLHILREFEKMGPVINPVNSLVMYSKENLSVVLSKTNIAHPKTLITENVEEAYEYASGLIDSGNRVVLKPLCKARGIGVIMLDKIRSRGDLLQFLSWYNRAHGRGVFYLQEYIQNRGYDIRCMVIDGEVVGREMRSNPNDFRYNVSAGGTAGPFENDQFDELALKTAELVDLKITGLDILPAKDGTNYVLEANAFPGYKALMDVTGIPIHEKIADYLERLYRK
jgi:RimK family alpha-L-glutamate ligase